MLNRACYATSVAIILLTLLVTVTLYPRLPESIPTHWNFQGKVDSYGSKTWASFLLPGLMTGVLGLMTFVHRTLSHKEHSATVLRFLPRITVMLIVLFGLMQAVTLATAMGYDWNVSRILLASLSLFMLAGYSLRDIPRNPWMGIRLPWTLNSDRVWKATHELAGWVFPIGGLVMLVMIALAVPTAWLFLPIAVSTIVPIVYSFQIRERVEVTPGR